MGILTLAGWICLLSGPLINYIPLICKYTLGLLQTTYFAFSLTNIVLIY